LVNYWDYTEMHGQQNIKKIAYTMLAGWFLGTFAKVRKATISFVIRLSVRVEQLGSHWTDFHEILYLSIFWKLREN